MSDGAIVAIISGSFLLLGTGISSIVVYFANRESNKITAQKIAQETNLLLSKRIDELEKRDSEKSARIDFLESELGRISRAYNRALRFIRDHIAHIEIPDFMDTQPLKDPSKKES